MASKHINSGTVDYITTLPDIHKAVKKDIDTTNEKNILYRSRASMIEDFLNEVIQLKSNGNLSWTSLYITEELAYRLKNVPGFYSMLSNTGTKTDIGDRFEQYIGNIFNSLITEDIIDITARTQGSTFIEKDGKLINLDKCKKIAEQSITEVEEGELATLRNIKADISGKNAGVDVKLDLSLPTAFEQLVDTISKSTFSLKSEKILGSVSLGHSQDKKRIYGPLGKYYTDTRWSREQYYQTGINIINDKQRPSEQIQFHYNHLAFIYELTGTGLLAIEGENLVNKYFNGVDFLIELGRNDKKIRVRSTKDIINRVIRDKLGGDDYSNEFVNKYKYNSTKNYYVPL